MVGEVLTDPLQAFDGADTHVVDGVVAGRRQHLDRLSRSIPAEGVDRRDSYVRISIVQRIDQGTEFAVDLLFGPSFLELRVCCRPATLLGRRA